jgi:hypothetical protein
MFNNWEKVALPADDLSGTGIKDVGKAAPHLDPSRVPSLRKFMGILGTCVREAPEFSKRKKR